MSEQNKTFTAIQAQLDVIEAKLNQLLKKFGHDDEDLWDLHCHVYEITIEKLKEQSEKDSTYQNQSELFE